MWNCGRAMPGWPPRLAAQVGRYAHAKQFRRMRKAFILAEALEQVEILTGQRPALAVVDRGFCGHAALNTRVLISGTRRGLPPDLARQHRRRSAIEPEIGHMKTDGRPALAVPAEAHHRRCHLRRPLRLRLCSPAMWYYN